MALEYPKDLIFGDYVSPPYHAGEELELRMEMAETSIVQVAKAANIDKGRLSRILNGKASITPEISLRLGKVFDVSLDRFVKAQALADQDKRRRQVEWLEMNGTISSDVRPLYKTGGKVPA